MNRREFMDALERQLQDVPLEDRIDALQYYEDYFEDAGYEKEKDIIAELESPENVANIIKRDLGIVTETEGDTSDSAKSQYKDYRNTYTYSNQQDRQFNDSNYTQYEGQNNNSGYTQYEGQNNNSGYTQYEEQNNSNWSGGTEKYNQYRDSDNNNKINKKLLIIILICTLPITIGPVLGFFGAIFGIVVGIFCFTFGMYVGGIGCVIGAIALLATGTFPAASLVFGIGLILLSIALFATLLCIFMCRVVIPVVIDGVRKLYRYIFKDGEATA